MNKDRWKLMVYLAYLGIICFVILAGTYFGARFGTRFSTNNEGGIMIKKEWNQNETFKYDPSTVRRWEIQKPGQEEVVDSRIVTLTQYKISAKGDDGYFTVGYYKTHKEAKTEVDRLDALSEKGCAEVEEGDE